MRGRCCRLAANIGQCPAYHQNATAASYIPNLTPVVTFKAAGAIRQFVAMAFTLRGFLSVASTIILDDEMLWQIMLLLSVDLAGPLMVGARPAASACGMNIMTLG